MFGASPSMQKSPEQLLKNSWLHLFEWLKAVGQSVLSFDGCFCRIYIFYRSVYCENCKLVKVRPVFTLHLCTILIKDALDIGKSSIYYAWVSALPVGDPLAALFQLLAVCMKLCSPQRDIRWRHILTSSRHRWVDWLLVDLVYKVQLWQWSSSGNN